MYLYVKMLRNNLSLHCHTYYLKLKDLCAKHCIRLKLILMLNK